MTSGKWRAIYWLLRSPSQTCHAKPKTQNQQAPDATSFFPAGGMPTASSLAWKTFRKVRTLWHCSRLRSVALYLWLIVVISVRQSTVAAISGLHCWRAGYGQFEHKADSLIAKFKEAGGNGQRDWCMSRVTAIILPKLSASSFACWRAVNHYRDNAITYKAQRDKMPENWSWRTRQLPTCRCVSVMLLRSM